MDAVEIIKQIAFEAALAAWNDYLDRTQAIIQSYDNDIDEVTTNLNLNVFAFEDPTFSEAQQNSIHNAMDALMQFTYHALAAEKHLYHARIAAIEIEYGVIVHF
ncbi:hypothetical protein FRC11_009006 [Ceratobasidium sp. 423]|nr:hypothetical protein FRC11_009006 [Ceratobasidium sp. 423]